MEFTIEQLNQFLGRAALATYAGGGEKVDPAKADFVSRFPGKNNCDWQGDISDFRGNEEIQYNGEKVFTHNFFGGLLIWAK